MEPFSIVQLENDMRELLSLEKKEVEKILLQLSLSLAPFTEELGENVKIFKVIWTLFLPRPSWPIRWTG